MFTNNFQILIDEDEADNGSPIVPVTENKKKRLHKMELHLRYTPTQMRLNANRGRL